MTEIVWGARDDPPLPPRRRRVRGASPWEGPPTRTSVLARAHARAMRIGLMRASPDSGAVDRERPSGAALDALLGHDLVDDDAPLRPLSRTELAIAFEALTAGRKPG